MVKFLHQIEAFKIDATENQQKDTRAQCLKSFSGVYKHPRGTMMRVASNLQRSTAINRHKYSVQGGHCNACKCKKNKNPGAIVRDNTNIVRANGYILCLHMTFFHVIFLQTPVEKSITYK